MKYIHEFLLNKNNNIKISDKKYTLDKLDLIKRSNFLIDFFLKKNVYKGFKVLIVLPNSVFIPISIFSISFLGGVFSIIDEKSSKNTIINISSSFKPDFIITSKKNRLKFLKNINKIYFEYFINKKKNKKKKSILQGLFMIWSQLHIHLGQLDH